MSHEIDHEIYRGHITHLMHTSDILNRYRLSVLGGNLLLYPTCAYIYSATVPASERRSGQFALLLMGGLCIVLFLLSALLHSLSRVHLRIVESIEGDLAQMTTQVPALRLWNERLASRQVLRSEKPVAYQSAYFGVFWLTYLNCVLFLGATVAVLR